MNNQPILVSIGILSYNHEQFIGKVLNGILSQKVNFAYEILVNDDSSTDSTLAILSDYQQRFSDRITVFENRQNSGQLSAANRIMQAAKGKYLALCDGDDYWISDGKLQTQIDFLEANPDFIGSCHDALIVAEESDADNKIAQLQTKKHFRTISQFTTYRSNAIENWELLNGITYIQNCTLIWRKFDMKPYEHLFSSVKFNLDWLFSVVLSMQGKIQYINEPWAVYSDHSSGRTKKNYFFSYYFDKIKTLHQLKKMDFFRSVTNKRHIYNLLAKQYNDLLEGVSDGRKTKRFMLKCIVLHTHYAVVSAFVHARYFFRQRKEMLRR